MLRNPSAVIIASAAAQSIIRLASNVILARLLTPTAFALTSVAMLVLTGMQMISDVGIAMLALRRGPMDEDEEARLWTMQFIRGVAIGLVVLAVSEPIARMYGDADLGHVVRALALMPMLQGAQSLYPVMALGRRDLVPSFLIDVGGRLVGVLVSVAVALASPTVWALVAGTLASYVLNVVASFVMSGRPPRFVFDLAFLSKQWRFSRWIQVSSTLSFLGMQIDKALFPLLFGMSAFGLYSIGATFAVIPSQITQKWSTSVFYPLTAQLLLGGEAARATLRRVRVTMLLYSSVITMMMMAGSAAFFALLYKPVYYPAARFGELLAAGTFFEVAESSLRHLPLIDDTVRYEVLAVLVRLAAFAGFVFLLREGGADSYALSYVGALAVSHIFMLAVCVRRGYVSPVADLVIAGPLLTVVLLAYALPQPHLRPFTATALGLVVAISGALALGLIYRWRGLPSLPPSAPPEALDDTARQELGTSPELKS